MPKVSVVMPAYNAEDYIEEAIESILRQSFNNFEFIIINDGSTDKTKDIILSYKDPRIIYLENEKNSGIVVTLNKGLDAATGEYIARMDADDISVLCRLEKQVMFLETNIDVGVLASGIHVFGAGMEEYDRTFTTDGEQLKAELIFSSCIAHPTVMIRRKLLVDNDLHYDEEFAGAEDYHLWWRLIRITNISTLPDILHNYRIHEHQITQDRSEKYILREKKLLELRFSDIALDAEEEEKELFLNYCLSNFKWFSETRQKRFCDFLKKIIEANRNNKFFDDKALRHVFELAITFMLDNSDLTKQKKRETYLYAVSTGMITKLMQLKMLYYRKYIR